MKRRDFLLRASGAAGGAAAVAAPASAQTATSTGASTTTAGSPSAGTTSASGGGTKTVTVGAKGNGGNFAFGPAKLTVAPGTTVVWKWNGKGGSHNVVSDDDGPLDSGDPVAGSDVTYEHTFQKAGKYPYHCEPHESLGMVGTITVTDGGGNASTATSSGASNASAGSTTAGNGTTGNATGNTTGNGTTGNATGNGTAGNASANGTAGNASASGGASGGGTKTVNLVDYAFNPGTDSPMQITPGTTVKFDWKTGGHNIHVATQPDGANWKGHEAIEDSGFTYSHTFKTKGKYHYWCVPHKSLGMVADIQVTENVQSGGSGGGQETVDPEEMGVPLQAHYVGIATILVMIVTFAYTFFLLKYGESPNAKGGN